MKVTIAGKHVDNGVITGQNDIFNSSTPIHDLMAKMYHNGHIGDGIGDLPHFDIWAWFSQHFISGLEGWMVNYVIALPALAVVGFGTYTLFNMFSKRLAALSVWGVLIYGAVIMI